MADQNTNTEQHDESEDVFFRIKPGVIRSGEIRNPPNAGRPTKQADPELEKLYQLARKTDKAKRMEMRKSLGGPAARKRAIKAWIESGCHDCPLDIWWQLFPKGNVRENAKCYAEVLRENLFALDTEVARENEFVRIQTDPSHELHAEWNSHVPEPEAPMQYMISQKEIDELDSEKESFRRLSDFDFERKGLYKWRRENKATAGLVLRSLVNQWVRFGSRTSEVNQGCPIERLTEAQFRSLALHHATCVSLSKIRTANLPPKEERRRINATLKKHGLLPKRVQRRNPKKSSQVHLPEKSPQ